MINYKHLKRSYLGNGKKLRKNALHDVYIIWFSQHLNDVTASASLCTFHGVTASAALCTFNGVTASTALCTFNGVTASTALCTFNGVTASAALCTFNVVTASAALCTFNSIFKVKYSNVTILKAMKTRTIMHDKTFTGFFVFPVEWCHHSRWHHSTGNTKIP